MILGGINKERKFDNFIDYHKFFLDFFFLRGKRNKTLEIEMKLTYKQIFFFFNWGNY